MPALDGKQIMSSSLLHPSSSTRLDILSPCRIRPPGVQIRFGVLDIRGLLAAIAGISYRSSLGAFEYRRLLGFASSGEYSTAHEFEMAAGNIEQHATKKPQYHDCGAIFDNQTCIVRGGNVVIEFAIYAPKPKRAEVLVGNGKGIEERYLCTIVKATDDLQILLYSLYINSLSYIDNVRRNYCHHQYTSRA